MKPYNKISPCIQILLEHICLNSNSDLTPSRLYKSIVEKLQTKSDKDVADTFNVSLTIVELIKICNKNIFK